MNIRQSFNSLISFRKLVIISATLLMSLSANSSFAQTKYNTWSDPNAPANTSSQQGAGDVQKMVDDLNKLITDAERDRAAAPAFLRDLRDLTRRYDVPWRVNLVNETFSDGNFTANPTWRVTSGRWWVEKNFGLRAAFEAPAAKTNTNQNSSNHQSNEDIGKQLLGAILNQALGGNQKNGSGNTAPPPAQNAASKAAIHLDRTISNAFSAQIEFTSWRKEGSFQIVTYQGSERKAGYHLYYRAGQSRSLELLRSSRYGTNAIQTHTQSLALEDKRTHVLVWTRDRAGKMTVSVDGKNLVSATDHGFNDPFNGLTLINNGGDFIISKVEVKGTN